MERHQNYINGQWVAPEGNRYYQTHNPACPLQALGEFPRSTPIDVDHAIASADERRESWAAVPAPERAQILMRFAQLVADQSQELARVLTLEQGKPLAESLGEAKRAAAEAAFAAGEALRLSGQTFPTERPELTCYTVVEPLGVVATITPWNFPVVSPVRKIVPALACGNTVVFKPSSVTPASAVHLTRLLAKAGLPAGVLNLVIGASDAGERLVADERVAGISFTGSTAVGMGIAERAARRMAKVQLELGGKNPAIVVECGDLDGAAREIVAAAFLCSGQRCTALSRVLVEHSLADSLIERLLDHMKRIRVGNGLDPDTTMGPLVSREQLEIVMAYVRKGIQSGAKLITGGEPLVDHPETQGYYYPPTLFDHVTAESELAREEIFGPLLPVIRVRDPDQALAVANNTRYGLAASLFTQNQRLIDVFVRRVDVGMVHVNQGTVSQAHVPFGGVKHSGQGAYSIGPTVKDAFTKLKTVSIRWS
jgi:alpha-ketoglutaric semialdehyde dehydrogenase